jgi:membrane protease YdiL (CAAX protease family)
MKRKPKQEPAPQESVSAGESIFAAIWVVAFVIGRHFLMPWLDTIHLYAVYGLDAIYTLFSLFFFAEGRFRLAFPITAMNLASVASMVLLGAITYKVAVFTGVPIPFDLSDPMTIMLLLLMAPVLEELLFRQALWYSVDTAVARRPWLRQWFPLIATSVLFALAHFEAYFAVPTEYQPFVLYQTGYTFGIALYFGRAWQSTRSVGFTIALHFGFNFGFFMAPLV